MTVMQYPRIPVLTLLLTSQFVAGAQTSSLKRLKIENPIVTSFASPAPHRYRVALRSGQTMRLMVTRPTFGMVVRLIEPGSTGYRMELHFPAAPQVQEPIYWVANKAGAYQIEVAPVGQPVPGATYKITLAERRKVSPQDSVRLELQQLFETARASDARNELRPAIDIWTKAVDRAHEIKDRAREAAAIDNLAQSTVSLGQFAKATTYYEQAVVIHQELNNRQGQGRSLRNIATNYYYLGQFDKAVSYNQQALELARAVKDHNGEGRALGNLGIATAGLSQYEKAIVYYEQAAKILREAKDPTGEGRLLTALGGANLSLGRFDRAIENYKQALTIARESKERRDEGLALGNLGIAFMNMSQHEKAIEFYQQALVIRREVKDRRGEGNALVNMGAAYRNMGQYQNAIHQLDQAIALFSELKVKNDEGNALLQIAACYGQLAKYDRAISYYEKAIAIARESKNRRSEGEGLNFLGRVHAQTGMYEKAIGYHEQALTVAREVKAPYVEAAALAFLGTAHSSLREYGKAMPFLEQALSVYTTLKVPSGMGSMLLSQGAVYFAKGDPAKAVEHYEKALAIAREVKEPRLESQILTRLMAAWKSLGKPQLGIFYGKQSVNVIQSLRTNIKGLDKELQQSFLKGNEDPYHKLAELLIDQNRLAEAEQVLALLKEQEYFEFVRSDSVDGSPLDRRADPTKDEAAWDKRYREVGDKLVGIGVERSGLLSNKSLTPEQAGRLTQLETDLAAGNRAFDQVLKDLSSHFSSKPEAALRIEQLRETSALMGDLAELPPGAVAIYTLVGEDKFRAFLVTSEVQKAFEYPIKAVDLNRKVHDLRQVIRDPRRDPRPLAQELYKILLGGIANDLRQANAKTIMWSLDGTLRYLPLAALYDGEHYLIEQYSLSVFTAASNARLKDQPTAKWKAAGFGVTKAFEGAPALPSVGYELNSIIRGAQSAEGLLEGELFLDESFTQASLRAMLLKRLPVVHIASHFKFSPGNDSNSFLLMGDGSHLSLEQLKAMPNIFNGVQILTLSACNTGVGDEPGDGKEVEGFGTLAQRKGAKAVIASLWPVADASTSLLMREMYRIRESAGVTKVEALRQAQIGLLRGTAAALPGSDAQRALIHEDQPSAQKVDAPVFHTKKEAPYAHPYFWAPFFLMGNWL